MEEVTENAPVPEAPAETSHAAKVKRTRRKAEPKEEAPPSREPGDDTQSDKPRKWTPPKDPFDFQTDRAGANIVQLFKSETEGAWVIRFKTPPNEMEGYSKTNPHPVLKMLKEEGYKWGFDGSDGKGGWGKPFTGDAYGIDHMEAKRVLKQAEEMVMTEKEKAARTPF